MYKQQQKSSHRGEYKKTATAHDARRRREDNTFSIRKNKREESLQKRRNMGAHAIPAHGAEAEELVRINLAFSPPSFSPTFVPLAPVLLTPTTSRPLPPPLRALLLLIFACRPSAVVLCC